MLARNWLFAVCIALLSTMPCLGRAKPNLHNAKTPPLVVADFDGDNKADVAIGSRTGDGYAGYVYHIEVGLSASARSSSITVFDTLGMGLVVTPVDLDSDSDLDFVITSQPFGRLIGVWINDGNGKFEAGDLNQYSASIRSGTRFLEPIQLRPGNESLDTKQHRAFHFFLFARAQIPESGHCASLSRSAVILQQLYLKLLPSLRAPPISL